MRYKLKFPPSALKEWRKLSPEIKSQFKKQLRHRLETPHIDSARIKGYKNLPIVVLLKYGIFITRLCSN